MYRCTLLVCAILLSALVAPGAINAATTPPKVKVCHKGHSISVDGHAVPAHQAHGDQLGACRPGTSPPVPPPVICTPVHCPALPANCPPTTVITVNGNVTIIETNVTNNYFGPGAPGPVGPAGPTGPAGPAGPGTLPPITPCKTDRKLLFYTPVGKLGKVRVWIRGKLVRRANVRFRHGKVYFDVSTAGRYAYARTVVSAVIRRRGVKQRFRFYGVVHRCGGRIIVRAET